MAEWNFSKLWEYDINPYTGGGSLSPDVIDTATGNVLITAMPIPLLGETGTAPSGARRVPTIRLPNHSRCKH